MNTLDADRTSSVSAGLKVTGAVGVFVEAAGTKMSPTVTVMRRVDLCHCILAMDIDRHFAASKKRGASR